MASMTAAKEHVAEIRREKFSIGGKPNNLAEDLYQAVKNLSAELYAKDVHFLMELIQNAEDNEYPEGVDPSLEFVITSKDITNTGAPATLLVFNNEKGFSAKNIDSICSIGRSTKKGLRKRGYIGEKGIGFKSVFLITSQPYIFSNGYQIKFNEKPCPHCNVGYIVPEWVDEDPTLTAIQTVYGSTLPTTTLILPLKPEKVKPVKDQLSNIHPEVLLFLSKIKRLSVREDNSVNAKSNTVSAISISSEKNFVTLKSMDAESYALDLTAETGDSVGIGTRCGYNMWKQRFPVKQENKVDVRSEVDEWVITLAFPFGERLKRGSSFPGIYSFLPTETVTNFPFIMQADFLLASSRENILWDNKWNQGILDCIPVAFLNAFNSLVKSTENAPVSSLPNMFRFLPTETSSHPKLNKVRDEIKTKLMNETIVPCETYTGQKLFRKPSEVGRLKPAFWEILTRAKDQGVSFSNISSHGAYLLAKSFDNEYYNVILTFLEIKYVDNEWYTKCIGGSDLVMGVSEEVYLQLLVFIAEEWNSSFKNTNMKNIPVIKYIGSYGNVNLLKINACNNKLFATDSDHVSWLIDWNTQFQSCTNRFFLPQVTQKGIRSSSTLRKWLKDEVKIKFVTVSEYADHLTDSVANDRKLAVTYAHFLYHSLKKSYLWTHDVQNLCKKMPIVDNYGRVTVKRDGVLVPAKGSNWVNLIGLNPWRQHNYVELGEDYTRNVTYFGNFTSGDEIIMFLMAYVEASDVPNLSPPNAAIPTLSSPLTKSNTFLLLKWLYNLRKSGDYFYSLPEQFLSSIKNGSWLKISLSGCPGYRPPAESFMLESSIGRLLQNGSVLVDIPLVDVDFYGDEIKIYKDELKQIGVKFENKDACEFIGKRLMSLAASSKLTRDNVISILKFIRYLGDNYLSSNEFVVSIKDSRWLRTCKGDMSPKNSVLFSHEWSAAKQISDIPFIDEDYYGCEIVDFKKELQLLGVVVSFNQNCYQLVSDNLKSSSSITSSSDSVLLILKCVQKLNSNSSDKIVQTVKNSKFLKTNLGYKSPSECFLVNPEHQWGCLLEVFNSFPILDVKFYGNSVFSFSNELKKLGVMTEFEDASKEFTRVLKQHVSSSSVGKENVFTLLDCFKKLKNLKVKFPRELKNCIRQEKWVRTKLGDYRSPNECVLFGNDWESISQISLLPFIDDNFYGKKVYDYKTELKRLCVTTEFKEGAKFVANGVSLPHDTTKITPSNVYALLDSVKKLKETNAEIPAKFLEKLSLKKWIKTRFGYKSPTECLLFRPELGPVLKRSDGPFIDDEFYGSGIGSYKDELSVIGVLVYDVSKGCKLLSHYLKSHTNFETIVRVYDYLSENNWKPDDDDEDNNKIWIPKISEWVESRECVLHDKNKLFGDQLYVLENFKYESKTLNFFANVFDVKVHPSVEDYCNLWKKFENSERKITHAECCAFWEFVVRNWTPKNEVIFKNGLSKLPVLDRDSDGILLVKKSDVFIGDDLFLMDLFSQNSARPIFVWYPQPSLRSLTRTKLIDVYKKLGVQFISESAQKNVSDVDDYDDNIKKINSGSKGSIIKKGLFKLILGFLADPRVKLECEKRQEAVSRLLATESFETVEPMTVGYSLSFSCGDFVSVESERMIRWDKQKSKLFMQKLERLTCGYKNVIEYASHIGEVLADGVLWENEELVAELSELIRLGFLVDFDDEAVDFLMKVKNLELFLEDQNYIASTFSS